MKNLFVILAAFGIAAGVSATPCPSVQWALQHTTDIASPATWSVLTIDYDEDGKLDLITHESSTDGDGTIFARRGLGDGTFEAPLTIVEHAAATPAAYDLDGNGHLDLIVAVSGHFAAFPGLGTAAGFGTPVEFFTINLNVTRLTVGNFDSDPAAELLAVSSGQDLFVLYDFSGGTFVESQRVTTGDLPTFAAMADFDNDGRQDVVVGERLAQTISVYFRNANGTFAAPMTMATADFPYRVAVGDIDGDGLRDFVASHWEEGTVRVFRNAGARQFTQTTISISTPGSFSTPGGVALQDLDADGHLDLVTASVNSTAGVVTFMGLGDGTFRTPTSSSPSPFTQGGVSVFGLANLDGTGTPELIAATFQKHMVFSLSCATQVYATAKPRALTIGQDAILDIAVSGFQPGTPVDRGTVSSEGQSIAVPASGRVLLHVPDLSFGDHDLTVTFSGNADVAGGTSEPVRFSVTSASTTTTLFTPGTTPVYGTPWGVIVTVKSTFNTALSQYTLVVDGVATPQNVNTGAVPLNLEPGPHTIQALFEGSQFQPRSESAVVSVTAIKATPEITTTGALVVRSGTAHAVQFTVAGSAQTTTPTGTLQLVEGTSVLASGPLVNGTLSFASTLVRGTHNVQAIYSGDSKFFTKTTSFTLQVLSNSSVAIEARGLSSGMHIAWLTPDGTTSKTLQRRVAGTPTFEPVPAWNPTTGMDPTNLTRGIVYEYMLVATVNGSPVNSNTDTALLFTDDALTSGMTMRLGHFSEMRLAINELRTSAGLAPFNFAPDFHSNALIRASHINSLRTALNEARTTRGFPSTAFPNAIAGTTKINANDIQQMRELAR